jgi:hypothetical protein
MNNIFGGISELKIINRVNLVEIANKNQKTLDLDHTFVSN